MVKDTLSVTIQVPVDFAEARVDQAASALVPSISRSRLRNCILSGELLINNARVKPASKLVGGEQLALEMTIEAQTQDQPENIPLKIIYQDEHLIVIDKPASLVVHPAVGNRGGTLLNSLLYHFPNLDKLPRAGIVHRLDKDTSGLLVVACSELARQSLTEQLKNKTMSRIYYAVCHGATKARGEIDLPIGRNQIDRKKMAVVAPRGATRGKNAKTIYQCISRFNGFSLLKLRLTTGRTHQIRVHLQAIDHPIVGDSSYGGKRKSAYDFVNIFARQALHATELSCRHPHSGKTISWVSTLPEDMKQLIDYLKKL